MMNKDQPRDLPSSPLEFALEFALPMAAERRLLQQAHALESATLRALHEQRLRWMGIRPFWSMLNKFFVETKHHIRLIETFLDDDAVLASLRFEDADDDAADLETLALSGIAHYEKLMAGAGDEKMLALCEQVMLQKREMADWLEETLPKAALLTGAAGNDVEVRHCC